LFQPYAFDALLPCWRRFTGRRQLQIHIQINVHPLTSSS
jgi:hypothetical protein